MDPPPSLNDQTVDPLQRWRIGDVIVGPVAIVSRAPVRNIRRLVPLFERSDFTPSQFIVTVASHRAKTLVGRGGGSRGSPIPTATSRHAADFGDFGDFVGVAVAVAVAVAVVVVIGRTLSEATSAGLHRNRAQFGQKSFVLGGTATIARVGVGRALEASLSVATVCHGQNCFGVRRDTNTPQTTIYR